MGASSDRLFVFVLDAGFTMQAFSSAVEVLRLLHRVHPKARLRYKALGLSGAPVRASNGFALIPDLYPSEVPSRATLIVVAGAEASKVPAPALVARLRDWARRGHPVWGVSSGVVRLAQAGLLNGRSVSAHWEDFAYLRQDFPKVKVTTALFTHDAQIATCAGGGAASDLMLHLVRAEFGPETADEIAARLVIDAVRDGRAPQRRGSEMRFETANHLVFAALRRMRANLFAPLSIARIAADLGISQRQLERLFMQEFDQPPGRVYAQLRLEDARLDVLSGRRDLTEIALDYGYKPVTFSRVYKRLFGVLPSDDRKRAMS
ncbi:helix-turn-helix domain-containing protein [Ruegeria sp. 2012CJ41-6]|uniref:Helix-turn-helix domain-containing protein n=1 Tax=Ruegeria spongiae TaxID=2942209 RepID=A0ABT0Q211_9RHOB|nr:helix-turn-helix domain-containing protein [Ruegeria spongiae]MCL6283913.1 helix-turn-helix domain-containing protein [Ruegeria spongiae]